MLGTKLAHESLEKEKEVRSMGNGNGCGTGNSMNGGSQNGPPNPSTLTICGVTLGGPHQCNPNDGPLGL